MLFNSYIFIFLFLPLCLAGFYLLERLGRKGAARVWLTGFSLWFYGYFNVGYLLIMAGSIVFNYCVFRLLLLAEERGAKKGIRKAVLFFGVVSNLAVLIYFKYYDFFVENCNQFFGTDFLLKHILLPLGISFFTFQQIGFLADVYRKEAGRCSFVDYALFVSFFPQLIAGPIVNYAEMMPQLTRIGRRNFSWDMFARGLYLFTMGLAKKVLIADTFGLAVNYGYASVPSLSSVDALLVMLYYTLQLYFDFSGYCDMARGIGFLFGITIPVNFNSPYKAENIIDFWKRWHITLNRFLMKNVYIPLGGSRKGTRRMFLNLLIVFFVSGLWHGAGWTYLIWGMLNGVLYCITRVWQLLRKKDKTPGRLKRVVCTAGTYLFMNLSCVFFRAESPGQAVSLFNRMLTGGIAPPAQGIYDGFNLDEFWYVLKLLRLDRLPNSGMYLCLLLTVFTLWLVFFRKNAVELSETFQPKTSNLVFTAALFFWCVLSLSGVSTFLYFNF